MAWGSVRAGAMELGGEDGSFVIASPTVDGDGDGDGDNDPTGSGSSYRKRRHLGVSSDLHCD